MMLKYVGSGDFINGVPAMDLEEGAVEELGRILGIEGLRKKLIRSGLYVPVVREDSGARSAVTRDETRDDNGKKAERSQHEDKAMRPSESSRMVEDKLDSGSGG